MSGPVDGAGVFDAATPAGDDVSNQALVTRLEATYADEELVASLGRLAEVTAVVSEHDDDLDEDGHLDAELVATLERISGAADAGVELASLHRRVEHGLLTWEAFWADPTAEPGGVHLFNQAIRAPLADAALLREQLDDYGDLGDLEARREQPPRT